MAKNDNGKVNTTEKIASNELLEIEVLKEQMDIPDSIFTAIKIAKCWADGKQVSKETFETAIKSWLKSPIDKGKGVK